MSALYAPTARPARPAHSVRAVRTTRAARAPRAVESVLLVGGAALVPWLVVLTTTLPPTAQVGHWNVAWAGLDALEALGLVATGLLLRRGDGRHRLTAAATCALLVVDAWFDTVTAAPGAELATALAMAVGAELPLAVVCAALALKTDRKTGPADAGTALRSEASPTTK